LAIGKPDPTTPVVTGSPEATCVMCIGPPLPLQVPLALPMNSATKGARGMPLASWSWMPR
jgi:hypothetical protein